MPRLVIVLDFPDLDALNVDPHDQAAEVLHEDVDASRGARFSLREGYGVTADVEGSFVSAEWAP